jgi:superfamily II DNA or RNA helicase
MISLRDYQGKLVDELRPVLSKHRSTLVVLPTGGGKTAIATFILSGTANRGKTGWFICHRSELIYQTSLTFERFGIAHSFIAAGMDYDPNALIHIVSVDTLKSRVDACKFPFLAIWDEAHHIVAPTWLAVKDLMQNTKHIGLSATPERLDGSGLIAGFTGIVQGPTPKELIERGFLSQFDFYGPAVPDLTGIKSNHGEFAIGECANIMSTPAIVGDVLKSWTELAENRITIGFAPNITTSKLMVERFNAAGIPSAHIDGNSGEKHRRNVAKQLASGEIRVLWNVGLLGEGYDLSAQAGTDVTIDCVIDASPTKSLAKFLQRCGRALRPKADGSRAVIIDCAGNWHRLGSLPDTVHEWTLDAPRRNKEADNDNFFIRQCTECFHVHQSATKCPACGFAHPVITKAAKEDKTIELKKIEAELHARQQAAWRIEEGRCVTLDDWKKLAYERGYSPGWAWRRFSLREAKRNAG